MIGTLITFGIVLLLLPLFMLALNKLVYGQWLMFPWSRNNPYNATLRDEQAELKRIDDRRAEWTKWIDDKKVQWRSARGNRRIG